MTTCQGICTACTGCPGNAACPCSKKTAAVGDPTPKKSDGFAVLPVALILAGLAAFFAGRRRPRRRRR